MIERWLPVEGFLGYEVSDQGRVRSLDRVVQIIDVPRGTAYTRYQRERLLRPKAYNTGHLRVALGKDNTHCRIHRLVLEAFVGPCPDGMWCRHIDGNPANNALSNIVWDTRGNNERDKKWHKGVKKRLNSIEVTEIKNRLSKYYRGLICELAREFDVTHGTISHIKYRRAHIDV